MDMKEASAMTEASGLVSEQGSDARPIGSAFAGLRDPLRRAAAQGDHRGAVAVALRRLPARHLGRATGLGDPRAGARHGQKAQDLSDLAGFLRSRDRGAVDEGGAGGMGCRQQPFPPGRRQGDRTIPKWSPRRCRSPAWCSSGPRDRTAALPNTPTFLIWTTKQAGGRRAASWAQGAAPAPKISDKDARKAAAEFEREQKRRDAERRKEEAAREKERAKRAKLVAKAQTALDTAQREHEQRSEALHAEQAAIEKRVQAEDERWEKERQRLAAALRRARD